MRTSCTLPLDPPLNILSSIRFDGRTWHIFDWKWVVNTGKLRVFCRMLPFLACGFGESVYSIAYFLQEEEQEHPGRTRLYCHIATLSSITEWILCFVKEVFFFLYSVPFRQCHSHSHRHLQASSTLVSATWTTGTEQRYTKTKQSSEFNKLERLFFMILVNLVVLLLCSCLFWVLTLCWLERSIKFDWFDCVRLPNLIEPNRWIKFDWVR